MLRLYRILLHLYPSAYLNEFAEEMTSAFREAERDCLGLNLKVRAMFCIREISGVLSGALREQIRYPNRRLSMGRFDMRSFRFPRATIVLMLMILFGVVVAIERGRALSIQQAPGGTVPLAWWPAFTAALALVTGAGVTGYGILFLLGRAGTQRIASIQTDVSGDRES